jgi:hypothetical protein
VLNQRDPRIHYIDILKQYLLGKKDWVGLSPTRPLKMKFTSIDEKEQIGKRRKLSRDEEARSTTRAKNKPNFSRIPLHGVNTQSHHATSDILDWDMNIQISTPKRIGQVYEKPESSTRPRSASSDTMLSEAREDHNISVRNVLPVEENRLVNLDTQNRPQDPKNQYTSDQFRQDFDRPVYSPKREMSAGLPVTRAEQRSSPVPVLHRFTLDAQVLAERMANSKREAESSTVHRSDYRDFYLHRNISGQQDALDDHETLLSFSAKSKIDDRYTNIPDSPESNPTDSDVLPQTQKISRKLPPSQAHLAANTHLETPIRTLKNAHDISVPERRPVNRYASINNGNNRSPTLLFGQEVPPISPDQPDMETPFRFPRSRIQQNLFVPNIHGYRRPSPPTQPNNTPMAGSRVKVFKAASVTETPRPASTFRFPDHWTPQRNIQRHPFADNIDQDMALPASAFVTPPPQRSPFTDTLNGRDQHAGVI